LPGALRPFAAHPVQHQPRLKKAADDAQQALVADAPRQTRHQDVVVDPVEELFQVDVHDDLVAVRHVLPRLAQRVVRAAPSR
jgi:hypothetical protein